MSADVDGETNDRVDGDDNDDCAEKARPRRRRRIADRATAFIVGGDNSAMIIFLFWQIENDERVRGILYVEVLTLV